MVQTRSERLTGPVEVRPAGLIVGAKTVALDEVLYAVFERKGQTLRQPNTVRLTDGEVWHCEVLSLAAGKLKIHSHFLGTREVEKAAVQALEFQARLPEDAAAEPDMLYRQDGEALPGKVLWIDRKQVAVDSPLGAMALDRQGLTRLILSDDLRLAAGADQADVVLADGTVLRGRLRLGRNALVIEHPALGEVTVAAAAVRSVLRHPAWATYLTELACSARSRPLLDGPPPQDLVQVRLPDGSPGEQQAVRSLTVQPDTQLTFALTGPAAGKAAFRATLAAVGNARGDARLRILAGERPVLEKVIAASQAEPEAVEADLSAAGELRIEVSFGRQVRFPCGVVLGDPHLVAK